MKPIDTDRYSEHLRTRSIDVAGRRLLMSRFDGSEQQKDLSLPPNCGGFGRVHHFKRFDADGWPSNPLPLDPACRSLALPRTDLLRAQVFQNAACNWRCWYCYVPFQMLSANLDHADWVSVPDLVGRYASDEDRAPVLDLSGGQPDLVPEWIPWTMRELQCQGIDHTTYLWSDDNLSNDYLWRFVPDADLELMATYAHYGRVCCFKGFDSESFAFNTRAAPEMFDRQFDLMRRLVDLGIDLYAYATFTTPTDSGVGDSIARFVDRLQKIHPNLPLRTVPLRIQAFSPVMSRLGAPQEAAMRHQWLAIDAWMDEIGSRFSSEDRERDVSLVALRRRSA